MMRMTINRFDENRNTGWIPGSGRRASFGDGVWLALAWAFCEFPELMLGEGYHDGLCHVFVFYF
ncbi:hypothetical protein DVG78_29115 [Runella aurantiaca]|uniref:Uncharacterized protein n=1 Tax=Runella aurantiaca TaxID=2282308 RepID=A0A369I6V2_9BACT|nr:hypothetical protein DVG78_29115 [Runella aurantiaca]